MAENEDIVERIKRDCPIDKVMAADGFTLRSGSDKRRKCTEHDSLVVDVGECFYWWNSNGEQGDVITWVMKRHGLDFKGACEYLCRMFNIPEPNWGHANSQARVAARAREEALTVAARVFNRWLLADQEAFAYAHGRGWTDETINSAQLGYSGKGTDAERQELNVEMGKCGVDPLSPAAVSILGFKGNVKRWLSDHDFDLESFGDWINKGYITGMLGSDRLVYPHMRGGRVVYMAGRGIHEKHHYNLHQALAGDKEFFYNLEYRFDSDRVIIVEGQADAVSLGQMGYPAVALGNVRVKAGADQLGWTKNHKAVYIALDQDKAGHSATMQIADQVGPMARLLQWDIAPYGGYTGSDGHRVPVKDANDLLKAFVEGQVEPEKQKALIYTALQKAPTYVEERCFSAGQAQGAEKDEAIKAALLIIARMSDLSLSQYRTKLSKALGVSLRDLADLLKKTTANAKKEDLGEPIYTFGGYFPATGWIVEYLYDPISQFASFAWRDDQGNIGNGDSLVMDGQKYLPYPVNDTIRSGAVSFPSKLGEEKPLRELITIVELFIKTHYLLPSDKIARMMAYFVMMTWLYDCFDAVINLRAMGDAGSGKSEMMRRIGLVTYRFMTANGAGSTSAMFRMVERYKGTVFIDEADLNNSDTSADMVKFINLGNMKNNPILRTVEVTGPNGNKDFEEKAFQTFCPKMIAMRKDFQDDAVGTRCLTFIVQPREQIELRKAGIPNNINNAMREQALAIRNLLLRWRLKNWKTEIEVDANILDDFISARLNQVAGPMLMLAMEDPIQQEEIRQNLRDYYQDTILDRSMTISARVIEAIWKIMKYPDLRSNKEMVRVDEDGISWIKTNAVTSVANQLIAEMNGTKDDDEDEGDGKRRRSKELTSHGIGRLMRKEMQLRMSERRRDGFWVMFDEIRMEGLSIRFGVKPEEQGPIEASGKGATAATQGRLA
jgi:hypothetical protein